MEEVIVNNEVTVKGKVHINTIREVNSTASEFEIECSRESMANDIISCLIKNENVSKINTQSDIVIKGQFRSRNWRDLNGKSHTQLYVYVTEVENEDFLVGDINKIHLSGTICKVPTIRKTPSGRVITDLCLAINRVKSRKSDYIPCIGWNKGAKKLSALKVGDKLEIFGRIQSRVYLKKIDDETTVEKTAYEVSIKSFNIITPEE